MSAASSEERTRRRRWDAGQVVVTARDLEALTFCGEQYGLRDDALAVLLARLAPDRLPPGPPDHSREGEVSPRRVRGWVERMERAGYLTRRRLLGHLWVTPTREGLDLASLPYDRWNFGAALAEGHPGGWILEHAHATTVLRLALEREHPGGGWIPEREFRRLRQVTGARVRVPDGAVDLPDGRRVGVEVELSRKKPESYRHILRDPHTSLDELRWYTRPELVGWLSRTLEATDKPIRPAVEVLALPELPS